MDGDGDGVEVGGGGGSHSGPAWLRIGIRGFAQYTAFPLHLCEAVTPVVSQPVHHNNNSTSSSMRSEAPLVMHVHTFDQPLGEAQNPDLVKGLSRHLVYHRCALRIDHYEVVA